MSAPLVTKIDLKLRDRLQKDLESQNFALSKPPYTLFSGRKKGITVTLYESGKLVVQGSEKDSFIQYYLEPEILQDFSYSYPTANLDTTPRIGVDESGKGDFFGPLCIVGLYADEAGCKELVEMGVKDSKQLVDATIKQLASKIKGKFAFERIILYPEKYNELYGKFKNLNRLLAWGHATVIDELMKKTGCKKAIIDQFGDESLVINALSQKKCSIDLTQRHKGEEDPVVAAASILARDGFIGALAKLEETYGVDLPKGASGQVKAAGKKFITRHGKENLGLVAKTHFKTYNEL